MKGFTRLRLYLSRRRSADGRPGAHAGSPRAPPYPGYQRRGSVRHRRGLQQLRPLHHARPGRLVAAGGLREWRENYSDARRCRHLLRDGARHASHPAQRPAAYQQRHPQLMGDSRGHWDGTRSSSRRPTSPIALHRSQWWWRQAQHGDEDDGANHADRSRDGRLRAACGRCGELMSRRGRSA